MRLQCRQLLRRAAAGAPSDGLRTLRTAAIFGTASLMLTAALWRIDRGSVWLDEQVTIEVAQRTLPQLFELLRRVDIVHGFYYVLMHAWMQLGTTEVWARVPSALAMATAAGLTTALGIRTLGLRAGTLAGLVFTSLPIATYYAQEARSYALVCAMVLAATYCLVRAADKGSQCWWWAYGTISTLACLLHELAVLSLAAHAATLALSRVSRKTAVAWLVAAATCTVLLVPLVLLSKAQAKQVAWLAPPDSASVWLLLKTFAGPNVPATMAAVLLACLAIVPAQPSPGRLRLRDVALPLAVVPPTLLMLASQVQPLYHHRYVLYSMPGLPLLVGGGLERLCTLGARARSSLQSPAFHRLATLLATALAVVLITLPNLPRQRHLRTTHGRKEDLAAAARLISRAAAPDDAVLFLPTRYRTVKLAYPTAFHAVTDIALMQTPAETGSLLGREYEPNLLRESILYVDRVWVLGRPDLAVDVRDESGMAKQALLAEHFTEVTRSRVHGVEIRLYKRAGGS